jgi:hypothetical protein
MAICNALTGVITKSCLNNSGGINRIFIADWANIANIDDAAGTGGDWITDITMVATKYFFEFQTNKNVCNFTEEVQIDMTNGTTFFNQVLTLVLNRRETAKRDAIEKLINGQKQLMVIFQDSNSNYWLSGRAEGSYVTAITGGSGTAKADANNYTITFTAMEPEQAWEVAPAEITSTIITFA